jgi:hypothetical protein
MFHEAVQEQVDIGGNRFLVGAMHGHPKDLMKKAMMDDHPNEGAGGEQWVDLEECSLSDSCSDIRRKMVIEDAVVFPEKHLGQFMAFERAEEQQSQQGAIHSWPNPEAGDQREHPAVIPFFGGFFNYAEQLVDGDLFGKDCAVERALRREMLEDQRFTHTGGTRDLLRRGPVEPFGGKERSCCGDETGLTLLTGGPRLSCHGKFSVSE